MLALAPEPIPATELYLPEEVKMDDDAFFNFCALNKDRRFERESDGTIIMMFPAGGESGCRNSDLTTLLNIWSRQDATGKSFDSSTGFILPDKSTRSPDASWVLKSRLKSLTKEQRQKFLPLCPDFAIELKSPSDCLSALRKKMAGYIANGTHLAWLLNPETQLAEIFRPGQPTEEIQGNATLTGDSVLPGFTLDLYEIWKDPFE